MTGQPVSVSQLRRARKTPAGRAVGWLLTGMPAYAGSPRQARCRWNDGTGHHPHNTLLHQLWSQPPSPI